MGAALRESNHGTSRIRRLIVLAAMTLSAGLTTYKAAVAPITYDEAYTYLRFARKHTGEILSDYEYPNNHILHTLAVRASTRRSRARRCSPRWRASSSA